MSRTQTRRRPSLLLPDGHGWLDLVATLVLSVIALAAFADSFTGHQYLVVGAVGVVIGVAATHLTRALGWPLMSAVVAVIAAFFLLGGPLTLRSLGDWTMFPGGATLARLADLAVFGWKDLLTTLPPVDGDGQLLVLPWLLGLVAGVVTTALTQVGVRRPWVAALLPVAAQVALLCSVVVLGVHQPRTALTVGAAFTLPALMWLAWRVHHASATVRGGRVSLGRVVAAGAILAVAVGVALPASELVMVPGESRLVARTWVEPPFDIGQYPSPLAGFRRYVDPKGQADPANVHDKTLFEISGVEAGARVRFAALDRYDGMVWGASDTVSESGDHDFKRVSSTIHNPVPGRDVEATVTLGEGWAGAWLPTVGALQTLDFQLGDAVVKAESFRYNIDTRTAVVPSGLHRGDRYTFTAVEPEDELEPTALAWAQATSVATDAAFVQGPARKWTEGVADPMTQVLAAARHLRTQGRYSDGIGRTERHYVAGHNVWRLSDEFVNAPQMVGNDEQYAAVMALLANEFGVPARVVVGAIVPEGGRVTGRDVSAWVELRVADGSWRTLATERFMSHQPPAQQTPQTETPMTGTVIPPPNPIPPPSDAGEQSDADLKERKATRRDADDESEDWALPGWLRAVLVYGGVPLLALALLLGAVVAVKLLRRRRRRTAASTSARFVGGWRELVDHAHDLGHRIPSGPTATRREQSRVLASAEAAALARSADTHVFGPSVPADEAAAEYWRAVEEERRAMSRRAGRRRRWLALVDPRTLRPGRA